MYDKLILPLSGIVDTNGYMCAPNYMRSTFLAICWRTRRCSFTKPIHGIDKVFFCASGHACIRREFMMVCWKMDCNVWFNTILLYTDNI